MPRKHISLKTKLAAALRELGQIPYTDAKMMSEDHILSLFHFDHGILHGIEPIDEHWNLTPRLIAPHREKSKADNRTVKKSRRIEKKWSEFLTAVATGQKPPRRKTKRRWGKRTFPKPHRRCF